MTIKINVMPLARKAHESMMKEGRGMHLWGLGRRFERSRNSAPDLLRLLQKLSANDWRSTVNHPSAQRKGGGH